AAACGKPGALLALPCPGIAQGDATVFGPQGHAGWDVLPPHKAVEEAGNEAVSGAHGVHHRAGHDAPPVKPAPVKGQAAPLSPGGHYELRSLGVDGAEDVLQLPVSGG